MITCSVVKLMPIDLLNVVRSLASNGHGSAGRAFPLKAGSMYDRAVFFETVAFQTFIARLRAKPNPVVDIQVKISELPRLCL